MKLARGRRRLGKLLLEELLIGTGKRGGLRGREVVVEWANIVFIWSEIGGARM